jgi:putative endonuclease
VADWYAARQYRVVARNWRCRAGELDLVVVDPAGTVVFCEVKTRSSGAYGSPFEAVTAAKLRRLRQLAGRFLAEARPLGLHVGDLRIDVAAVRRTAAGLEVEVRPGVG